MRLLALALPLFALRAAGADANPDFRKGLEQLGELEFRGAQAAFQRALKHPDNSPKDRARIYLQLGIAQANLLDDQSAAASFRKALTEDRAVRVPRYTSPKIRALFDNVLDALPSKPAPKQAASANPAGPAPPPSEPALDTKRQPPRGVNWAAWSVLAAGLAAGGAGIALGLMANSEADKADDASLPTDEARQHQDRSEALGLGAAVLYGTAAVAAVTAGLLFWKRSRRTPSNSARLILGPTQAAVQIEIGGELW